MEELSIQPSGIFYQANFITPSHEKELIDIFRNRLTWPEGSGRISLHYGLTFDYKTFGIDPNIPFLEFPDWLIPLLPPPDRESRPPDQVCLQYYPRGSGIPPHADTHSVYDQLYGLSIGGPVLMQFCEPTTKEKVEIDLAAGSMMQMSGASRLHWTHGIRKRKTDTLEDGTVRKREDRWSITYRWLREGGVCECGDEGLCDTARQRMGIEKEYRWKNPDGTEFGQGQE